VSDVTTSEPGDEDVLNGGDEQLIRQLVDRARSEGLQLTGETSHPEICQAAVVWMSARRCCQAVSSL